MKLISANPSARPPHPANNRQSAIALVITLIFISVIAFMAVTFLVLSQRERGAVSVNASQTAARLAAETGLQRATATMLAPVIAYGNPFYYDLTISANYINPDGYFTGNNDPTNVNYAAVPAGNPTESQRNIANLLYDPRPPVFVTNRATGGIDFRYYLDLNRNGRADPNGYQPEVNNQNALTGFTNFYYGDPEWIGVLERPELPHSANNKFIARVAWFGIPAGRTLDLNYIHNQAKRSGPGAEGFLRNQGVGSWELNLAGFLTDLNTNQWLPATYAYNWTALGAGSAGVAFEDALALLRYRYNGNYNNLTNPVPLVDSGSIDEYANGNGTQIMTGTGWGGDFNDAPSTGYPGGDNPQRFFSQQDLFSPAKVSAPFIARLNNAGAQAGSYERSTFYRLISQLGTDSAAETGKVNLNYDNLTPVNGVASAANYLAWTPLGFFTNVADRLFLAMKSEPEYQQAFGANVTLSVTNIMVWPTNQYTPAVHRVLQLAANIYDATTNRVPLSGNLCAPTVFRPLFRRDAAGGQTNVIIAGYREVVNDDFAYTNTAPPMVDLSSGTNYLQIPSLGTPFNSAENQEPMLYGYPLVVGAKKGFPSFNTLAVQTAVRTVRKLNLYRPATNVPPDEVRQMYQLSITNTVAVEAWNSYSNRYPRSVRMVGVVEVISSLTNELGVIQIQTPTGFVPASNIFAVGFVTNILANQWAGFNQKYSPKYSFQLPVNTSIALLTNCSWRAATGTNGSLGYFEFPLANSFASPGLAPPHWWLNVSTRVRFIMVDTGSTPNRILDYVNLSSDAATLDITSTLMNGNNGSGAVYGIGQGGNSLTLGDFFDTNLFTTAAAPYAPYFPTFGVRNQIAVSSGDLQFSIPANQWKDYYPGISVRATSITNFRAFLYPGFGSYNTNLVMQAPFSPYRTVYQYVSWQANDPLVHYMKEDLTDLFSAANKLEWNNSSPKETPLSQIGTIKSHYRPWGGRPGSGSDTETEPPTNYQLELKDPLALNSDSWDFPSDKFPTIGKLGQVHRGTPWQTVYMKSPGVSTSTWQKWTGNQNSYDAALAMPERDWHLFDFFTTAPNDNATHGLLPVNQTGLAAWSAVLTGVLALDTNLNAFAIPPAGVSGELQTLVDGINGWRTNAAFNGIKSQGFPGCFTNVGGVLAVPELSVNSPYLGSTGGANITTIDNTSITDAVVERIPQQIMSLLRLGDQPRFVLYAYGQALKPADRSIVTTGPFTGLCTNYQITAEAAVRAVVRVDGAGVNDAKPYHPRIVIESYNVLPPD